MLARANDRPCRLSPFPTTRDVSGAGGRLVSPAPVLQKLNIVRTQVVRLTAAPLAPGREVRDRFRAIFDDRSCLTNDPASVRFRHAMPYRTDDRARPFLRGLGELVLDIDRATLEQRSPEGLAQAIGDPSGWRQERAASRDRYFYFDPALRDERMNFIAYSLLRPLALRTTVLGSDVRARAYVHVYPCGFAVLQLSQALVLAKPQPLDKLRRFVSAFDPQNADSGITWRTPLGAMTLPAYLDALYGRIAASIDGSATIANDRLGRWHTSLRLGGSSACDATTLAKALLDDGESFTTFEMSHRKHETFSLEDLASDATAGKRAETSLDRLFFHRDFFVATESVPARSDRAVRAYWRILKLVELALFQHEVVSFYTGTIDARTTLLAKGRRTPLLRRVVSENALKTTAYDATIPAFLEALDGHIRFADGAARYKRVVPKFRRKLYSAIADADGLVVARARLATSVDAWLEEADAFEPALAKVLKLAIEPLKKIVPFASALDA